MPNLFSDNLSQIQLADIEQFLNLNGPVTSRPIEGPRLDFKKDVPQDIGRSVAGLANSYGGVLLVGVETDKAHRNVPISLPGADLGPDPRARLTDQILATVHPRPDVEIQPIKAANPGKTVALVRVREGPFPPYEFVQGATTAIPVRIEDSTRQATLREIEALLKKRELMGRDAQQVVDQYLKASGFFCSIERGEAADQLTREDRFFKIVLVPRIPLKVRLDLGFERRLSALIHEVYKQERNFVRASRGMSYADDSRRGGNFHHHEFRISGKAPCHRVWRVWSDGTLGFVTNHSRIRDPEPLGNLALELLFFFRLAKQLFPVHGFYGASVLACTLACPSHKLSAQFPADVGDYDNIDGVFFDTAMSGQPEEATFVEEVDWDTLEQPAELVASLLLDELRAVCGARVDWKKLLEHVKGLPMESRGSAV